MKALIIALGLTLSLGSSSFAKTPKEVITPYKAYVQALESGNKKDAAQHAYKAWQVAERKMGASKTTGDLAFNFAELRPRYMEGERETWKLVMSAFKRSIRLSEFHDEAANEVEIDRRVKYLSWQIPNISRKVKSARDHEYSIKRLLERVDELGFTGSTFEAEAFALGAHSAMIEEDWDDVVVNSNKAISIYDTRDDSLFSIYEYAVPIYLARAYVEQKRPIEAALTYQNLMTKLETSGGHKNAISGNAYAEWLSLRDEIAEMETDDPRVAEVVNFAVPTGRQEEHSPLVRQPPVFPANFLRGNHSGYVKVKFNIDPKGYVQDPVVVASTNKKLHEATLESIKKWRYSPNLPRDTCEDVETMIRFDLMNAKGKKLPYSSEKSRL